MRSAMICDARSFWHQWARCRGRAAKVDSPPRCGTRILHPHTPPWHGGRPIPIVPRPRRRPQRMRTASAAARAPRARYAPARQPGANRCGGGGGGGARVGARRLAAAAQPDETSPSALSQRAAPLGQRAGFGALPGHRSVPQSGTRRRGGAHSAGGGRGDAHSGCTGTTGGWGAGRGRARARAGAVSQRRGARAAAGGRAATGRGRRRRRRHRRHDAAGAQGGPSHVADDGD